MEGNSATKGKKARERQNERKWERRTKRVRRMAVTKQIAKMSKASLTV